MSKKGTKRRVYSPGFKAETAAVIEKREKPVSQTAADLGVNENMLRKWVQKAREPAGDGLRAVSRAWPAEGRGTGPPAEGSQGAAERQSSKKPPPVGCL
jgi:transposase-like protein